VLTCTTCACICNEITLWLVCVMKEQNKSSGNKLSRTETVTVRLEPKLKYLAEIAARKQRRTLSSFIEWAVEESLKKVNLHEASGHYGDNEDVTVTDVTSLLWDIDESERFLRLAINYPELLTYDEQEIYKWLLDSNFLKPAYSRKDNSKKWDWNILEEYSFPALRNEWKGLKDIQSLTKEAWIQRINEEIRSGKIYPMELLNQPASSLICGYDLNDDIPF